MKWKDQLPSADRLRESRVWRLVCLQSTRLRRRWYWVRRDQPAMAWAALFGLSGLLLSILLFLVWPMDSKPVITPVDDETGVAASEDSSTWEIPQSNPSIVLPPDPFAAEPVVKPSAELPTEKFVRDDSPFRKIQQKPTEQPIPETPPRIEITAEPSRPPAVATRPPHADLQLATSLGLQRAPTAEVVQQKSPPGEGLLTRALVDRITKQPWPDEPWKQTPLDRTEKPVPLPFDRDWLICKPTPPLESLAKSATRGEETPPDLPSSLKLGWTLSKKIPQQVNRQSAWTYQIVLQANETNAIGPLLISEEIPAPWRIVDAEPPAHLEGQTLNWHLTELPAGKEAVFEIKLAFPSDGLTASEPQPKDEPQPQNELGADAMAKVITRTRVQVLAELAASTRIGEPGVQLALHCEPIQKVTRVGKEFRVRCTITNIGSVNADGVRLEADLPDAVEHPYGHHLKYDFGALPPGGERTAVLIAVSRADFSEAIKFRAIATKAQPVPQNLHIKLQQPPRSADADWQPVSSVADEK